MKNYINFKTAHLGLFILLSFLGWGCQNDDIRTLSPQTINAEEQIEVKDPDVEDGILIFQTRSHFESILAEHKAWDDDQRLAWEEEIGFTSQYSQLMKILDAEESSENAYYQAHLDAGVSMEEIFSDSLPKPPHSSIYLKAMEEGWIVIHEDSDTANVYSPNSPIPYCTLLGLEGFIKIGDTLSHYTRNQMKHWVGGQIENRDLLHRMNQTRLEEGILVSDGGRSNLTRVNNDWGTESFFFRFPLGGRK